MRGRCSFDQVLARALPAAIHHHTAWRFALSPDERRWRALLHALPQLWQRTDQQARCGDFVAVDMSAPRREHRRTWAIEVKLGAPLRVGGGGASNQLTGVHRAVDALAALGVARAEPVLLTGDGRAIARVLGGTRGVERSAPR
ncbi:MAG: hypothetical protein R3F59_19655 [Myxococcota bacterium]